MKLRSLRRSLLFKMAISGGLTFLLCIALWIGFNVLYFQRNILKNVKSDIAQLSETVLLGLQYAMMLDSADDIREIINNISQHEGIEAIRIFNKQGRIMYSTKNGEEGSLVPKDDPSCWKCHARTPPPPAVGLEEMSRVMDKDGVHVVGIMTPIPNLPGCDGPPCHAHTPDQQLLGLLDMEVDTALKRAMIHDFELANLVISLLVFLATFTALFIFAYRSIVVPIRRLIVATREIGSACSFASLDVSQSDEIGLLAHSFNRMGRKVAEKHKQLIAQREDYRDLFNNVPCLVSVVDRQFRVIRHNRAYAQHFGKGRGQHCYQINKGQSEPCTVCPVARTFEDGLPHFSEETGLGRDGNVIHWIVYTSPVWNREGEVVAAMEMMLDITARKELEFKLAASEQRYQAIFEAIPSALFVLDAETLQIVNCNESVTSTYGYAPEEVLGKSFLLFFREDERDDWNDLLRTRSEFNPSSQFTKDGRIIYVSMRVSPAEFQGQKVLIASCSDVTKRLLAEQQLIQAGKMSTLGEMATGVAHELNQPLAILKTISNYITRKLSRNEPVKPEMLQEIAESISTHVDRAGKIIEHMREFGRKSDLRAMPVQINKVLQRGFEFFRQQLDVRNIQVEWRLSEDLPEVLADSNRLEQVIINLLLNARDAIELRWGKGAPNNGDKRITIISSRTDSEVAFCICDTGTGIPAAIRDKLFEPFFTTKDVGKGTGLGLSISYGIVQDYGGHIRADSLEEGGACFTVTFPIADLEALARHETTD